MSSGQGAAAEPGGGGGSVAPVPTYAITPPREVGELIYVFRRDLIHLRTQIEEGRTPPSSSFFTAAWASFGVALTACIGIAGFYGVKPHPAAWEAYVLIALACAAGVGTVVSFIAGRSFEGVETSWKASVLAEVNRLGYHSQVEEPSTSPSVTAAPEEGGTAITDLGLFAPEEGKR
jgi:hypothetical protein